MLWFIRGEHIIFIYNASLETRNLLVHFYDATLKAFNLSWLSFDILTVIVKVLHMMVGRNISDEQLGGIADRAINDADTDRDGAISFDELKRVSISL